MLISLLALACNDPDGVDAYDVDTWRSPLASAASEPGDAGSGEAIFYGETWDDGSWGFTCSSCHSSDAEDTLLEDADALNRPGHSTWNAPWRASWKGGVAWDDADSEVIGAYGGQVCVKAYWPEGAEMGPQQAADLEAFMRTQMDDDPGDSELAQPLDFGFTSWDTQDEVVASLLEGEDWLRGEDIGDTADGEAAAIRHCGSCHGDEEGVSFASAEFASTGQLLSRVRKVDLEDLDRPNERMPRLPEDRLPDEELLDLLAWLTEG